MHTPQGPQWEAGLIPSFGPELSAPPLPAATEACCELCGLYFENRKALASHARAHLRQFGVTEWCVNGSPIETLSEWIKHRPQKVGAYRSYIQSSRPFTKKFRSAGHGRDGDRRPPLGLAPGGLAMVGRSPGGEPGPEAGRAADSGERPLAASPPGTVKAEEHQRQNINSECWGQRVVRVQAPAELYQATPRFSAVRPPLATSPPTHLCTHPSTIPPVPGPRHHLVTSCLSHLNHSLRPRTSCAEGRNLPRGLILCLSLPSFSPPFASQNLNADKPALQMPLRPGGVRRPMTCSRSWRRFGSPHPGSGRSPPWYPGHPRHHLSSLWATSTPSNAGM